MKTNVDQSDRAGSIFVLYLRSALPHACAHHVKISYNCQASIYMVYKMADRTGSKAFVVMVLSVIALWQGR